MPQALGLPVTACHAVLRTAFAPRPRNEPNERGLGLISMRGRISVLIALLVGALLPACTQVERPLAGETNPFAEETRNLGYFWGWTWTFPKDWRMDSGYIHRGLLAGQYGYVANLSTSERRQSEVHLSGARVDFEVKKLDVSQLPLDTVLVEIRRPERALVSLTQPDTPLPIEMNLESGKPEGGGGRVTQES